MDENNMYQNQNDAENYSAQEDQPNGTYQSEGNRPGNVYQSAEYQPNNPYQSEGNRSGNVYQSEGSQPNNAYQNNGYMNNNYQNYNNQSQPYQQYQPYGNPQPYQDNRLNLEEPVKISEWVLTFVIMMVPCVNIIMMFVWAFSSNEKKSKSNFFKAYLIYFGIMMALMVLFSFIMVIASSRL